ncbi:hypothetical protein EDD21DRAFT_224038 [Dissophora ornata]|nr:hypothetical protein EDD21DRAFT_224038 [Dissophora ornata]
MAVAMLPRKKLKNRSSQRSPSTRAFEELDEDMAIISSLEKEPWQPDLLLERQSDSGRPIPPSTMTTTKNSNVIRTQGEALNHSNDARGTTSTGFQGVIPMIIKSPATVITTTADADTDSDCMESIFGDQINNNSNNSSGDRIPTRVEEYLQQTRQEQEILQQQQHKEIMQTQMELQLPQLHYQLPAHLQSTANCSSNTDHSNTTDEIENVHVKRRQPRQPFFAPEEIQQYRNSFHGHTSAVPFSGMDDQDTRMMGSGLLLQQRPMSSHETHTATNLRSESPLDISMTDHEDAYVIESLQSLKNITMLALDGLLQQVVSDVTARDPVHNPDESTLQARALIRRKSIPVLDVMSSTGTTTFGVGHETSQTQHQHQTQRYISDTLIAGVAASSHERLDELVRKVDQLAAAASDDQQQQQSNGTLLSSNRLPEVLQEPFDIPARSQESSTPAILQDFQQQQSRLNPSQVFESEEYQLACALAAMLACIYRILNRMQQQQQEPRATPMRTESVDSGLDQASRLWMRLSSNSFARSPRRQTPNRDWHVWTASPPSSSAKRALGAESIAATATSTSTGNSHGAIGGTNSFMQSINKQVRTLKSRRTQSTSHIEVAKSSNGSTVNKPSQGRLLGGLRFGPSYNHSKLGPMHPEDVAQIENAKELEQEWTELDTLMDEMAHLWRFVECLDDVGDDGDEGRNVEVLEDDREADLRDPFHDRNQILQQQRATAYEQAAQDFDRLTLEMAGWGEELPQYDDAAPQYNLNEKADPAIRNSSAVDMNKNGLARRISNGYTTTTISGVEDEKTRIDLNSVMSAIERLSKVAPRMDNQRVQLSPSQQQQMARASVAHTIDRLSRDRQQDDKGVTSTSSSTPSSSAATRQQQLFAERTRDLNKLVNQIVESASKASFLAQRAEFSPRQQWKLEEARVGDQIERGERLRMSDQVCIPTPALC